MRLSLPVEVQERVIDHLARDDYALRQCCLVCRDWVPRSRKYIFREITIQNKDHLYSISALLTINPPLRLLVKTVTFYASTGDLGILYVVPVPLLSTLPNLRRWNIAARPCSDAKPQWLSYSPKTLACLKALTTQLRELHLFRLSFSDTTELARLVAAFSRVHTVYCQELQFRGLRGMLQSAKTYGLVPMKHVSRLDIRNVAGDGTRHLFFLTHTSLEELTFDLLAVAQVEPWYTKPYKFSQLRSLTVHIGIHDHEYLAYAIGLIAGLITNLMCSDLRHLRLVWEDREHGADQHRLLGLHLRHGHVQDRFGLLEHFLLNLTGINIHSVTLSIPHLKDNDASRIELRAHLERTLPALHKMGMLVIEGLGGMANWDRAYKYYGS